MPHVNLRTACEGWIGECLDIHAQDVSVEYAVGVSTLPRETEDFIGFVVICLAIPGHTTEEYVSTDLILPPFGLFRELIQEQVRLALEGLREKAKGAALTQPAT